ncbi:hypothetical protein D3C87_518990 [compost metagenome]
MWKSIPVVGVLALLAGCATWGQMDTGLSALHGRQLSTAVNVLGYPTAENRVAGMRQVMWSSSNSGVLYLPQTSTTYGTAYGTGGYANYSATTNYMAPMAFNHNCTITLRVSDQDVILGHQYQGNLGGCTPYIEALTRAAKAQKAAVVPRPLPPEDGKTPMLEQQGAYLGCIATEVNDGVTRAAAAARVAKDAAIDSCEGLLKKYRAAAFRNAQIEQSSDPIKAADDAELALRKSGRTLAGN